MRIAITGIDGFVGRNLAGQLRERGHSIIPISRKNGHDISRLEGLLKIEDFDVLFHLAAQTKGIDTGDFPYDFYNTNIEGTYNILELCKLKRARLIFFSSYVYGSPDYQPIDELHPVNHFNPYAHSKIVCEQLCEAYQRDFNVPVLIFRPFNIYGLGQSEEFLLPTLLKKTKTGKIELKDPRPKRDFIYIDDVVSACLAALKLNTNTFEIINLGTGKSHSIQELIEIIRNYSQDDFEVEFTNEYRKHEVLDTIADIRKARKLLNWQPNISLEEGLLKIMQADKRTLKQSYTVMPKVIVLILSYNGKSLLEDSVSSYLANDYSNFEVVVVDNGSTDGSREYVESNFRAAKVLRTEVNLKYSGGLNFGMKYAFDEQKADYVLITNNDVKVDQKIISSLVDCANTDDKIGFVIGKVYYYDQPDTFQSVGKGEDPVWWNTGHIGHMQKDTGQFETIEERAFCDDIYWLVNRKLYEKTGGYDTEFAFQGEDFDWQVRAKQLGYKIMYTPHAKLWHKESMTIGKSSPFKAYFDARNPLIIHMKYRSASQFKKVFHTRLKQNLKSTFKMFLKFKWEYAWKVWSGFFSAIAWGIRNKKLSWKHII